MRRVAILIILIVLRAILTPVAPAWAQPSDGTPFEGTQEAGGPVRLTLAADPARIVAFEIEGVAGGGCSWATITLANWDGEIALADGQFSVANADGDTLTGVLADDGAGLRRLEGTIQVRDPARGCETPPLRWVAMAVTP